MRPEPATVLMLPGLLCDAAAWSGVIAALPGIDCRVAGYGRLDAIPAMAAHVLASVAGSGLRVAGHSMGGRIALEMARQAPERIDRIALLDTGFQPRPGGEAGAEEERQRWALVQLARDQGMRAMGERWAQGMVHPDHLRTPVFEAILRMIERSDPEAFEAQVRALLSRPDARDVLATLRCPTLLACGREDAWSPLARHQEMRALAPRSQLVVIEHAGHMAPMEQPGAVAGALRSWALA
ncbi:alpha/beta fold hydrolase [Ramlibacter pallidus]|uniref:Alpha/beta fold hydrolase n=1 Tax=Ramlibacter pallidus TaxID=2780087 RepID=A0ABR9S682_9BURK|nr:alpha/beta fold hydrolase [Ramlibacter pallidus]MBE7369038.1 alpha/beta fold hydrolase [Ramlibacter pallidus]